MSVVQIETTELDHNGVTEAPHGVQESDLEISNLGGDIELGGEQDVEQESHGPSTNESTSQDSEQEVERHS